VDRNRPYAATRSPHHFEASWSRWPASCARCWACGWCPTQLAFVYPLVGLVIAAAPRRWTARPARTFLHIALVLTAVSLVPPFLVGADLATSVGLVLTHLAAAAIMIPVLVSRLPD
jgi:hypothetical protein